MSASAPPDTDLLTAARTGDRASFDVLVGPLGRELHIHCYRMLGSLDDADDALQETLLRVWRGIDRFEPRAPFRAWLYRIATNACLTFLASPEYRRERSMSAIADPRSAETEMNHLEPYPDRWLDEAAATPGPEATIETAESVELAFLTAVQSLPARQRAAVLLKERDLWAVAEGTGDKRWRAFEHEFADRAVACAEQVDAEVA